jgi:hypothetical protein
LALPTSFSVEGWRGEQLAGALDVAGSNSASEEAAVADAVVAAGQHVHERAADELGGVERHSPEPVAAFDAVVLPLTPATTPDSGAERGSGQAKNRISPCFSNDTG